MLATLLAAVASGELFGFVRRLKSAAITYVVAGVLGFLGIVFLIVALFVFAARLWGPVEAAVAFGLSFLVLAGLVVLVHSLAERARTKALARQRALDAATVAGATAVSMLPLSAKSKAGFAGLLVPLVAAAGFAIYQRYSAPPINSRRRKKR